MMNLENLVYTLERFERKGLGECEVEIYFHSSYYAIPREAIKLRDSAIKKVVEIDIEESIEKQSHLTFEDATQLQRLIGLYTGSLRAFIDSNRDDDKDRYTVIANQINSFIATLRTGKQENGE